MYVFPGFCSRHSNVTYFVYIYIFAKLPLGLGVNVSLIYFLGVIQICVFANIHLFWSLNEECIYLHRLDEGMGWKNR